MFSLSYLTTMLGQSRTLALIALSLGGACNAIAIPLFGALSDRFDRRAVYGVGAALGVIWTFAFFPLLNTQSALPIVCALVGALIIHAMMYGPQAAFIAEQFPTRVRYTGSSLAYTLAGIVGGGVAPAMFATLMKLYKTTTVVAAYTVVALLITGAVLLAARRGVHARLIPPVATRLTRRPHLRRFGAQVQYALCNVRCSRRRPEAEPRPITQRLCATRVDVQTIIRFQLRAAERTETGSVE